MSQSPLQAAGPNHAPTRESYLGGWDELANLIRQGHSFSGRERNCVYLNAGIEPADGPGFADVSSACGLDLIDDARGLATVDWDLDGDVDVWLANRTGPRVRLMVNQLATPSSYVQLQLQGTQGNRDAIGARVELLLEGPQVRIKTLRAGEGFLSQSSKLIHFGLAATDKLVGVRVRWPGVQGAQQFANIRPNGRYLLIEGDDTARRLPARISVKLDAREVDPLPTALTPATAGTRVVLTQRHAIPASTWRPFDGQLQPLPLNANGGTLINLWASWCQPCLAELDDLKQHANELRGKHPLNVLALSIDESLEDARTFAAQLQLPFDVGLATESIVKSLTELDHHVFYRQRPLPLPCSFLLDSRGRLAVIYKGPVAARQLLTDLELLDASVAELADAGQPFAGRRIAGWFAPGRTNVALAYLEGGYLDDAKRELQLELRQPAESANHVRAYQLLSEVAGLQADTHAQLAALQALERLTPNDPQPALQQVAILAASGQRAAAEASLSALESTIGDNSDDQVMLAQVHARMGHTARAIELLARTVARDRKHAEAGISLALAKQMTGATEEAIEAYRVVLKQHPDRLDAANNLAWLLATESTTAASREEAVTLARSVCTRTHDSNPSYLDTLAVAFEAHGDRGASRLTLQRAIPIAKGRGEYELMRKMSARLKTLVDAPVRQP